VPRFAALLTGVIVLTLALGGCATPAQTEVMPELETAPVEDFSSLPPTMAPDSPMGAQSFSYLEGTWTIIATDAEGHAILTADPSGDWELAVMGDSMTVFIGDRRYEGILVGADGGWSYYGMVTGMSALDEPLDGYIDLTVTNSGDGAFTGVLSQYLDPDGTTPALSTRWDIEAVRH